VGNVIASDERTCFIEVDTTCDIGFNGTYFTWAPIVIVVANSAAVITVLPKKNRFFMLKLFYFIAGTKCILSRSMM
jgi:hypothetical protein